MFFSLVSLSSSLIDGRIRWTSSLTTYASRASMLAEHNRTNVLILTEVL
jgi:hypothetical protein